MNLNELIKSESILFLDTIEMKDTIKVLAEKAIELGVVKREDEFEEAILSREELVSTGIGLGISIPHAKMNSIEKFFVILGICKNGLDWDSVDRKPVRAVFMIGGPEAEKKEYLRIMSKLILIMKNEERRNKLFMTDSKDVAEKIFSEF